ncbi:hypothetical protein ATANTOWER_024692 [Ataeniobius toweri]|uniref:Uncharacterized protein n=1 Tax=Ataeniobius toweri TaxID=208326 RepID=A0ABU7AQZ7_9TELE|nr:hypothetical protein [Ataeniobius toweri]
MEEIGPLERVTCRGHVGAWSYVCVRISLSVGGRRLGVTPDLLLGPDSQGPLRQLQPTAHPDSLIMRGLPLRCTTGPQPSENERVAIFDISI